MSSDWIVVGICGASCSGKTTISNMLEKHLPNKVTVIHQDDYFHEMGSDKLEYIEELDFHNWDIPSALDLDRLIADIKFLINEKPADGNKNVVVVEGNMFLADRRLWNICDHRYFLTLPFDLAKERRSKRTFVPADVPFYFEKVVWREYIKLSNELLSRKKEDLICIDGRQSAQEMFQLVLQNIKWSVGL